MRPTEFDVGKRQGDGLLGHRGQGQAADVPGDVPLEGVLLDKIDLVPFLDADVDAYIAHVREVNAAATILPTSTRTGAGMGSWS